MRFPYFWPSIIFAYENLLNLPDGRQGFSLPITIGKEPEFLQNTNLATTRCRLSHLLISKKIFNHVESNCT
jgi:hypothetical protein